MFTVYVDHRYTVRNVSVFVVWDLFLQKARKHTRVTASCKHMTANACKVSARPI